MHLACLCHGRKRSQDIFWSLQIRSLSAGTSGQRLWQRYSFHTAPACSRLHSRHGTVPAMFPKRGKALFKLVNHTIELVFFCYMIPYAFLYLRSAIESGQVSPACGIPMDYIQAAPFVCFILAAFRIVQRWWIELQVVRAKEKGGEESCQS